ncbi:MAG TPA: hypothetical protein VE135_01750 [Pyrinomonadaceae bacterium]|nr:hypothetical protein [Pyrinomonadaceae bacterium]
MSEAFDPIACDRDEDRIAFLYGELGDREARSFDQHRRNCPACESELLDLGWTRQSIAAWRDQSLCLTSFASTSDAAVAEPRQAHRRSALAAIRSFFELSPLWLKGAAGFAVLLLCVLTGLAISGLLHGSHVTPSAVTQAYSQREFEEAVNKKVDARLAELASQPKEKSAVGLSEKNRSTDETRPARNSSNREMTAANATPKKQSKPLTRAERYQLAADLRLVTDEDDDTLQLLGDRLNRDK